jgi:hypothetical protein
MSNHFISLQEAKSLTERYRNQKDAITAEGYKESLSISESFDAEAIRAILNQTGCTGFRAYFGLNEENKVCLIFVGVNADNEDIINSNENSVIVEKGKLCPPNCISNPL